MKNAKDIQERIDKIMADERLHYPSATIVENAPLALIQFEMETKLRTLYWVLGKSMPKIERN